MELSILVIFTMIELMGRDGSSLEMSIMLVILRMELCKEMAFGETMKDKSILVSGKAIKLMVTEFISQRQVIIKVINFLSRLFH